MPKLEIGLFDGSKLNFDRSFLQFNVKKNIYMLKLILFILIYMLYIHIKLSLLDLILNAVYYTLPA